MNHRVISIFFLGLTSACQTIIPPSPVPVTLLPEALSIGSQTERGLLLNLDAVFFEVNQATLRPEGIRKLDEFISLIQQNPSQIVYIEGHTDSTGDASYNQRLSQKRADHVRDTLISKGIESGRLIAKGLGESRPLASNATPEGRQKNRRVEILISKETVGKVERNPNCLYHPPLAWRKCDSPLAEKI